MVQQRTIDLSWRRELEKEHSGDGSLCFVTITHPTMAGAVRFVSVSGGDHQWNGETYYGVGFEWKILSDTDGPPSSQLVIENVSRRIGQFLEGLYTPPRVNLDLLQISQFDETTSNPRTPIGSPEAFYSAKHLFMTDVVYDGLRLTCNLQSWDYRQTEWPSMRATKERCPCLFR